MAKKATTKRIRTKAKDSRVPITAHPPGLILGAQLAMSVKEKRSKKARRKNPAPTYVVKLIYATGEDGGKAEVSLKVDDHTVFHSIILMMRTGPAYYHVAEKAIELASTQPSSAPGLTCSANTSLELPVTVRRRRK